TESPAAAVAAPPPPMERRRGGRELLYRLGLPLLVAALGLAAWHAGIAWSRAIDPSTSVLPTPWEVCLGLAELARKGLLVKYTVSSLFRVTWAYLAAVLLGVPLGL